MLSSENMKLSPRIISQESSVSKDNYTYEEEIQYELNSPSGVIRISNHVKPTQTIKYDLGSPFSKFRDLYLSGNTIYINESTISTDNNYLLFSDNIKVPGILSPSNGITLGHEDDSEHIFDTANLVKSSNFTLTNSHQLSCSDTNYGYIETSHSFERCYFSFSTYLYSGTVILCLVKDDVSPSSSYTGSNIYSFEITIDSMMYSLNWKIYDSDNMTSPLYSGSGSYNSYNVYSIGLINNTMSFFINGELVSDMYSGNAIISSIPQAKFKGRIVSNTKDTLTKTIHFNEITDTSYYFSGSYTNWAYNSTEQPYKYTTSTSMLQYYNSGTFLVIPKKGVWNIIIDYKWSTTGSYIRLKSELRKLDKTGSNSTTICQKGSSSDYIGTNLGRNAWVSDRLICQVKCNEWDKIVFYAQSGMIATSYPLRIRAVSIQANMIHPHNEDFF